MKEALIVYGGWPGHAPQEFAERLALELAGNGVEATLSASLEVLEDREGLDKYDLIVPNWSMGELSSTATKSLVEAVHAGTGLGGMHGGMGDAFRGNLEYEWMVGGHFLAHPHVGLFEVDVCQPAHPAVAALPERFTYDSEQYYMMVDPAVDVLATTEYRTAGGPVTMPVVWTRNWGQGRVFYSALGHTLAEFDAHPYVLQMTVAGLLWAMR
ncbi:ThuA domain-containing protein [Coraliomargarita parva]|uniref:ThuA domain-containing protein n=1 Tax=Coraliomargarita parva TaxID=3014050 RepID=UPI0022B3E899|nr:ThuA domain-containing protein [Coraliomargarita parva]